MSKLSKSLSVIVMLLLVTSALFASKTSLVVNVFPYEYQKILFTDGTVYSSKYGIGTSVGLDYSFKDFFKTGADLFISRFSYAEGNSDGYWVFSLMGKFGICCVVPVEDYEDGHINFEVLGRSGIDVRLWNGVLKIYPDVSCDFLVGIGFRKNIILNIGLSCSVAWQDSLNAINSSVDLGIKPYIGIGYSL